MSIDMAEAATNDRLQGYGVDNAGDADRESRQWTLKGLAPETVEVTRDAAKRSGMKLNSFVSLALERAAAEVVASGAKSGAEAAEPTSEEIHDIKAELAKVRARSEQLESTVHSMSAILLKLCAERL